MEKSTNPSPTELIRLVDPEAVAQHRSLFCTQYDDCLEHAAACGWQSWSCERCPLYSLRREMAGHFARLNYHPTCDVERASVSVHRGA